MHQHDVRPRWGSAGHKVSSAYILVRVATAAARREKAWAPVAMAVVVAPSRKILYESNLLWPSNVLKQLAHFAAKPWQQRTFQYISLVKCPIQRQYRIFASIDFKASLSPIHDPIFFYVAP